MLRAGLFEWLRIFWKFGSCIWARSTGTLAPARARVWHIARRRRRSHPILNVSYCEFMTNFSSIGHTAPQKATSLSLSSSPAQRELPPKQPPPSLYRAAPRSGSSPQISLLPLASLSSSPAQRKLPPKQSPPSLYRAAPRSGRSPQSSLLPLSVELIFFFFFLSSYLLITNDPLNERT